MSYSAPYIHGKHTANFSTATDKFNRPNYRFDKSNVNRKIFLFVAILVCLVIAVNI